MRISDWSSDVCSSDLTWYTSQEEGSFSIRGFEAKPRKFAVFVRDEWENLSDTLIVERVPLYEVELDKSNFEQYVLNGDATAGFGWVMPRIWDNSLDEPNGFQDRKSTRLNSSN